MGSSIAQYTTPGPTPSCLGFDGTYLWSCDSQNDRFYKHRLDDLSVVESFPSPWRFPVGIYADRSRFFSADADSRTIYQHDLKANVAVTKSFKIKSLAPEASFAVFTMKGSGLWTAFENTNHLETYHF